MRDVVRMSFLAVVTVLTGCVGAGFVPELPPIAPPDLRNASLDAEVRATGPVRQMVERVRMNVEVVVNEKSDVRWWQSLSDAEKTMMRDVAASQRKSLEAQLAKSGIVSLDPKLKVLSQHEKMRDDGYVLRIELKPLQSGLVDWSWTVIRAATGVPVSERGAPALIDVVFDLVRRVKTVSIGRREVPKYFPPFELQRILGKTLQREHRLPVPFVTRTWDNGRYVEVALTDTEINLRNHQIVTVYERARKSDTETLDVPVGYGLVLTHEGNPALRVGKREEKGARAILEMYNPASGRVKIGQGVK